MLLGKRTEGLARTHLELRELESAILRSQYQCESTGRRINMATYMQARPPARNVILAGIGLQHNLLGVRKVPSKHSQVGIYPRDVSLLDRLRQRLEPAFGLPLQGILTPDGLVRVAGGEVGNYDGALRDGNFVHHLSVEAADWLGEREDSVPFGPGARSHQSQLQPVLGGTRFMTYSLNDTFAGAYLERALDNDPDDQQSVDLQAQRLATHRVEVRQRRKLVIWDLHTVLIDRHTNLGAQLVLDVLVLTKKMKGARQGIGRGIHSSKDEGARIAPTS